MQKTLFATLLMFMLSAVAVSQTPTPNQTPIVPSPENDIVLSCTFNVGGNIPYLVTVNPNSGHGKINQMVVRVDKHPDVYILTGAESVIWMLDRVNLTMSVIDRGFIKHIGQCKLAKENPNTLINW